MPAAIAAGHRPAVSIIIATYGRPDALNLTLASVLAQSVTDWEAIIVADGCPPDVLAAIDADDPRIRVVNLPMRVGHQYGPNSVGMALARGRYLAFLNHDDLWLGDHLARAIAQLDSGHASFVFARAAFCHRIGQSTWLPRLGRLVFSEFNQPRAIWRCLDGPNALFEPASGWVVDAELAARIGPWRAPGTVARTPVMDWVCEAARHGARFAFGEATTVLKLNLHHPSHVEQPTYALDTTLLEHVAPLLQVGDDALRAAIDDDVARAPERGLPVRPYLARAPDPHDAAEANARAHFSQLVETGTYPSACIDTERAERLRQDALGSLRIRTGEQNAGFPSIDDVLAGMETTDG